MCFENQGEFEMCGVDTSGLYFGTDWEDEEGGVETREEELLSPAHLAAGCAHSPYEFLRRFQSSKLQPFPQQRLNGAGKQEHNQDESLSAISTITSTTTTSLSPLPRPPVSNIPGADLIVVDSCRGEETRFYCRRHLGAALNPPLYVYKHGESIPVCEECFLEGLTDDTLIGGTDV